MNIHGREGPVLKRVFTCEGCKWLGASLNKKYRCNHDSQIHGKTTSFQLMIGNIDGQKLTPDFCPYLMLKTRNEKLKQLNELKN